jgi:hypothetical protein
VIDTYLISSEFCFTPRRSDVRIVVSKGRKGEGEGKVWGRRTTTLVKCQNVLHHMGEGRELVNVQETCWLSHRPLKATSGASASYVFQLSSSVITDVCPGHGSSLSWPFCKIVAEACSDHASQPRICVTRIVKVDTISTGWGSHQLLFSRSNCRANAWSSGLLDYLRCGQRNYNGVICPKWSAQGPHNLSQS